MKKNILTLALTGLLAMTGFSLTAQESKEVAEERKKIAEANEDLKEAKVDSVADFQKFKKEAEIRIKQNQLKIAELKTKKASDNKDVREKYHKDVSTRAKKYSTGKQN